MVASHIESMDRVISNITRDALTYMAGQGGQKAETASDDPVDEKPDVKKVDTGIPEGDRESLIRKSSGPFFYHDHDSKSSLPEEFSEVFNYVHGRLITLMTTRAHTSSTLKNIHLRNRENFLNTIHQKPNTDGLFLSAGRFLLVYDGENAFELCEPFYDRVHDYPVGECFGEIEWKEMEMDSNEEPSWIEAGMIKVKTMICVAAPEDPEPEESKQTFTQCEPCNFIEYSFTFFIDVAKKQIRLDTSLSGEMIDSHESQSGHCLPTTKWSSALSRGVDAWFPQIVSSGVFIGAKRFESIWR